MNLELLNLAEKMRLSSAGFSPQTQEGMLVACLYSYSLSLSLSLSLCALICVWRGKGLIEFQGYLGDCRIWVSSFQLHLFSLRNKGNDKKLKILSARID